MNPIQRIVTPGPWPNPTARGYSLVVGAATGLVLWALGKWVFNGHVPQSDVAIVSAAIPAVVSYFIAHFTRVTTAPKTPPVTPPTVPPASP